MTPQDLAQIELPGRLKHSPLIGAIKRKQEGKLGHGPGEYLITAQGGKVEVRQLSDEEIAEYHAKELARDDAAREEFVE